MPDLKGSSAAAPLILLQPLREGVEHFSELVTPDPPCHFCRENISRPVHEDCTRLKIVSRGEQRVWTVGGTGGAQPVVHNVLF